MTPGPEDSDQTYVVICEDCEAQGPSLPIGQSKVQAMDQWCNRFDKTRKVRLTPSGLEVLEVIP